jgi:hypothetical protein
MPASTSIARPIQPFRVLTNATGVAQVDRIAEKSGQTFLQGTPVQVDVAGATGFMIACPVMTSVATAIIAGFSTEAASNLSSSGVAQTLAIAQKPPNQPNASIIPIGSPPNDGTVGFTVADNVSEFIGTFGDSSDNTLAVLAQAQIGAIFGLFKDPGNSFWYVDNHVTSTAAGACVEVLELIDPIGTLNGRVGFKVTKAAQQLQK